MITDAGRLWSSLSRMLWWAGWPRPQPECSTWTQLHPVTARVVSGFWLARFHLSRNARYLVSFFFYVDSWFVHYFGSNENQTDRRHHGSQVKGQSETGVPGGPLAALLGSIWRLGGDYGRWRGWNLRWNAQAAWLLSEEPASCLLVAWGLRAWGQTPMATEGKVFTGHRDQHGLQRGSSSPEDHRQPLAMRRMWMLDGAWACGASLNPRWHLENLLVHPSSREIVKCDYMTVMYVIQFQVGLKNKKTESIFKPGCLFSVRRLARNYGHLSQLKGFLGGAGGKGPACPCRRYKRCGFDPQVGKILWRRAWQPTPVFLPREFPQTEEPGGLQS